METTMRGYRSNDTLIGYGYTILELDQKDFPIAVYLNESSYIISGYNEEDHVYNISRVV
jgi:hypothetical protein